MINCWQIDGLCYFKASVFLLILIFLDGFSEESSSLLWFTIRFVSADTVMVSFGASQLRKRCQLFVTSKNLNQRSNLLIIDGHW